MGGTRPLADRLEVRAPGLAALAVVALGHLPAPLRRRALESAFDRARDAFNRGDLEAVFALFAAEVDYVPPPALHRGPALRGRGAVFEFWRDVFSRFDENSIENLSLDEVSPGSFVRRARLHHRMAAGTGRTVGGGDGPGGRLDYTIVQTTVLDRGRVVRQVNELAPPD